MDLARHQEVSRQTRNLLRQLQGQRPGALFDFPSWEREQHAQELLRVESAEGLLGGYLVSRADDLKETQPALAALFYALEHDHLLQSGAMSGPSLGGGRAGLRFNLACALISEGSDELLEQAVELLHSTIEGCAVHATTGLRFHCWEHLGYALTALGDPLAAARAFQAARPFSTSPEAGAAVRVLAAEALTQSGNPQSARALLRSSWRDLHGLHQSPNGREVLERWRPFLAVG